MGALVLQKEYIFARHWGRDLGKVVFFVWKATFVLTVLNISVPTYRLFGIL